MSHFSFQELSQAISATDIKQNGVSFKGRSLKLDSKSDCTNVINAINECKDMTYLDLEGNTLGVDAAESIGRALNSKPELRRALWKDLFTGRMKNEIPKALTHLGKGLHVQARLTELDLSDNAFGPIGVEALAELLRSASCFRLEVLRLNNNGLGITGGRMLARALLDCYDNSVAAGEKPFQLKIFIAGRNRLENDGATALAKVFATLGSLEEIVMPQNGIYHKGILKLSEAFAHNPNLRVLNLNDNTVTAKGAHSLGIALEQLQKLQILNLGDCLLKTKGAELLAESLRDGHHDLEELILECNEIKTKGGLAIARALQNKEKLRVLNLGENYFGANGRLLIEKELKANIIQWHSDEEDEADSEETESGDDNDNEDDVENEESDIDEDSSLQIEEQSPEINNVNDKLQGSSPVSDDIITKFIAFPLPQHLHFLDKLGATAICDHFKNPNGELQIDPLIKLIMKISNFFNDDDSSIRKISCKLAVELYSPLFEWAELADQGAQVNNSLFVNLGLIKDEDKSTKLTWNTAPCVEVLKFAYEAKVIPEFTKDILSVCLIQKNK